MLESRSNRNYDIKVKFSKEEKNRLESIVKRLGLTLTSYIRMVSLNARFKVEK